MLFAAQEHICQFCPLLGPQHKRIHRNIKRRQMIRQRILQNGLDDVRCQRVQVDLPTHVAVVDTFALGIPVSCQW